MICRARPKYLKNISWEKLSEMQMECLDNMFFFNGASNATEFFLRCYNEFYKKKAKVAIQSFTCVSMLDAIKKSGSEAYLFDVSLLDCSLDYQLVKDYNDLDIIILTHYQGIPNKDYKKFKKLCDEKGILLFDDLSHGKESIVQGVRLGTLANVYIESYAWDKPYTVLNGGKLHVNDLPKDFSLYLQMKFMELPVEKRKKALNDVTMIKFLLQYTSPDNYYEDFDYDCFIQVPILIHMWNKELFSKDYYRRSIKIVYKIFRKMKKKSIHTLQRMHPIKCGLIVLQEQNAQGGIFCELNVEEKLKRHNLSNKMIFFEPEESIIAWNRFSFLDYKCEGKKRLLEEKICVGNYNWPRCLHQIYAELGVNCQLCSGFDNSEKISQNIVNVPIWMEKRGRIHG